MGILDDAIRDHLDLKRRRGAEEPELKKLEDEAFGPQGRPDASGAAGAASAVAEPRVEAPSSPEITPEDLGLESLPESSPPAAETPPPDGPAPEEPPAPSPDPGVEPTSEGGTVVFHDFAAEEGLVASGAAPATREPSAPAEPTDPVERALAQPAPEPPSDDADEPPEAKPEADAAQAQPTEEAEKAEQAEPAAEAPSPVSDDTQVHDMAKELDLEPDKTPPSGDSGETDGGADEPALELDVEELDIELTDEDADPGEPGNEDESEDVLEETPEFLRDTPESDRMWFEQGKPKDFDFDDE